MVNNLVKKVILKKLRNHIQESNDKDLYTVCTSQCFLEDFYNMESASKMKKLFKESKKCDEKLSLSIKDGRYIESLFERKKLVVGIYSASLDQNELQSSQIGEIIHEGINVKYKTFDFPDLNGKVYFPEDYLEAMHNLKNACKYGGIEFILTFPRSLVDEDGNYRDDAFKYLFNVNQNGVFIKPEFIDSYVVSKDNVMHRITKKESEKVLIKK